VTALPWRQFIRIGLHSTKPLTRDRARPNLQHMNLITFHRILIGAAIVFFVGYGFWEGSRYLDDGAPLRLVLAAGAFAAAAVLLLYLRRLKRVLRLPD
jgi:hypothetical protein